LARHDARIREAAQEPLSLEKLLDLLGNPAVEAGRSREDAIACYLSGGDGWREAMKSLDGTFAGGVAGLRERKDD
jgi:hypothetical protein